MITAERIRLFCVNLVDMLFAQNPNRIKNQMQEIIFRHLYEFDCILGELPTNFRVWQIIEMLSKTELNDIILFAVVA